MGKFFLKNADRLQWVTNCSLFKTHSSSHYTSN